MADNRESDNDCDNFDSATNNEVLFHSSQVNSKLPRHQKCFRKGLNKWNIDKQRLLQLQKLSSMGIPKQTTNVLSKLILNHQITEIGKIVKIRRNCLTITAKLNLQNANYNNLVYEDVLLKVFTRLKHAKPDERTAKEYIDRLHLEERRKQPDPEEIYFYNNFMYPAFEESLFIMRIDSIVVIKLKIRVPRLITLEDVLRKKSYCRRYGPLDILKEVLELVRASREVNYLFWNQPTSMGNIFYSKSAWQIVYTNQESTRPNQHKRSLNSFSQNVVALVNIFHRHGVSMEDIKYECYKVFKFRSRGFNQLLLQLKTKLGWSWPSFVDCHLKKPEKKD